MTPRHRPHQSVRPLTAPGLIVIFLLCALPRLHAADPAPATTDERLERLEQRIGNIERSLEQIQQLLQNQPPAAPGRPAASANPQPPSGLSEQAAAAPADAPVPTPASVAAGMKPGVMHDIWLRPQGYRGGVPASPSLVTIRDTRGPLFQLGRYADDPAMAGNVGKPVVQVWRCNLNIKRAGTHVLIAEFQRKKDRMVASEQKWDDYLFSWSARLSFGLKPLLDETNRFESVGKGTLSRTFTLDLEPGYYAVQLVTWMPKQADDEEYDLKPLTFALRLREPGELKPRDLGPADFFSRE